MQTALYSRVSTEEQATTGYSIGEQQERLEAYAKAMDIKHYKHYIDPGYSGGNLNRPAMSEMINDIKDNKIDNVIIWKLDRLSRSQKDTLYLVQEIMNTYKVNFKSLNENLDTATPMGIAMIGIMSAFAELERSQIKERMSMGREARAKAGYYHGGGNYDPLGYTYKDGLLEVNPYEAKIVKEMFDLYVGGNSIKTTAQIIWKKYPDRIKSETIIRDALSNNLYIGKVKFNGNTYEGLHEPIIDEETYYKAIEIRKKRRDGINGTNKRKGLLIGKSWCAYCGARFFRKVSGPRKYRYLHYTCYSCSITAPPYMKRSDNCPAKLWKEDELNNFVIEKLKELDIDLILKNETNHNDSSDLLRAEVEKIDRQKERLLNLYIMESIDENMLDSKIQALSKNKESLLNQLEEIEKDVLPIQEILSLKDFDWQNEPLEKQFHMIDTLVNRIIISNDSVDIYYNF